VQAICGGFRHSSDVPVQDLRANVKDMEKDLGERSERPISAGLVGINGRLTTLNGTISTQAYKITTPAAALFPPGPEHPGQRQRDQRSAPQLRSQPGLPVQPDHRHYEGRGEDQRERAKMADTIQLATPETAKSVQSTSKDLSLIVNRFAKPVSWLKGAAGTALNWAGKFFGF